ncbi:MAG: ketoacyl-ACP synthase III [Candidatus Binatia bacterium]|nr:ketoacyl-ACP synthase III [Candidatus Binatia bacterium]
MHLHALGHFHPENEITNDFLEGLDIGTNDQWILERVGIRARRTTLPLDYIRTTKNQDPRAAAEAALYTNAESGRRAAEMAIERAGIDKADIGLVLAGSSVMDTAAPAEACNVARALELEVPSLDVNSACTSFFANLYMLSLMQPEKLPPYVLVVCPEAFTRAVDYTDRSSAVLWGDAAVAAVVSTHVPGRCEILHNTFESSPAGAEKVVVPRTGHFRQDGRAVQTFAIRKTTRLLGDLRDEFANDARSIHFVGHQANLRMLEAVCRFAEMPTDLHHSNVEWFGNTAAAGAPSVVSQSWESWSETDDIAMVGVGAGLSWSGCLLRFGSGEGAVSC